MGNLKASGATVSAEKFNQLVDYVRSITLSPGVGYTLFRNNGGTVIRTQGGGAIGESCPFTVRLKADGDDLIATVSPGTVNGLVPSNIFDEFSVASSGTYYVKAVALTDGTYVTSVSLVVDTSEPEAQVATANSLPTSVDILLAIIHDGKAYRVIDCGSVFMLSIERFRTDRTEPAQPGELTYIPWYWWSW